MSDNLLRLSMFMGFVLLLSSCNGNRPSLSEGTFNSYYINQLNAQDYATDTEWFTTQVDEPCANKIDCGWELNKYH